MNKIMFFVSLILIFWPIPAFARITPEDIYQEKRAIFENQLNKISDSSKKEKIRQADSLLNKINQDVCSRFDEDIAKITAILEEAKRREGVTETVVAFGQGETPLETAAYWVNYAQEAIAYQKIQDYTPQIQQSNISGPLNISKANLKSNLVTLQQKIIRAKNEVRKALK